eukprot:1577241-Rhodomonas_salina.4
MADSTTSIGAYMAAVACLSCISVVIQNSRHRRDEAREAMLTPAAGNDDAAQVIVDMRHHNNASAADAHRVEALESAVSALEKEREEAKARQAALELENQELAGRIAALEAKVLAEPAHHDV